MIPLIKEEGINKLKNSKVIVFGCGGVGGFTIEALARAMVGTITIVDFDVVTISNKNRQIIALDSTIGKYKAIEMSKRVKDINPNVEVNYIIDKVTSDNIDSYLIYNFDYVIDCIDDVKAKLEIIKEAKKYNKRIISSMGTGNKLNPLSFEIKDISKTEVCPLAKKIRLALRKDGIKDVKVLFSKEEPVESKDFISSISFVPSVAGLLIAREVILDLIKE